MIMIMANGGASKGLMLSLISINMLFVLFMGALASVQKDEMLKMSSMEKDQRSPNSTMATKFDEVDPLEEYTIDNDDEVARMVKMEIKNHTERHKPRRKLNSMNPMDKCIFQYKHKWSKHRMDLANCAMGFGHKAIGGLHGRFYMVTDPNDTNVVEPKPGTLRHGVIQNEPLWIVFKYSMTIKLEQELIMNSFKTIDARGVKVHIAYGAGITIQYVTNIIIHGLYIHDCKPTGNAMVRSTPDHYGWRTIADGDGVSIFGSSHIWIDHNYFSNCADGLIDAIMGSTAITISNNYFTNHNEVMLLGHSDSYKEDKNMRVTIAYNRFGEKLVQRMPRCRHGYFHVVNNDYTHWEMYAIGGSADPTINSQGNRFLASSNQNTKEVTKRIYAEEFEWKKWNWRTDGDLMLNGAYFIASGARSGVNYAKGSSLVAYPVHLVPGLTAHAGPY